MNTRKRTQFMTMTALLTAIVIWFQLLCLSLRLSFHPFPYTLRSHIAIFLPPCSCRPWWQFCHPSLLVLDFLLWLSHGYRISSFLSYRFWNFRSSYLKKFPRYPRDKPKSFLDFQLCFSLLSMPLLKFGLLVVFYANFLAIFNVENMFYVLFVSSWILHNHP